MIKKIIRSEVELFRALRLEGLRLEPAFFASSAEDWEKFTDLDWHGILAESELFIAYIDESPSGIAALTRRQGTKTAHRASLGMVYIRRHLRGRGEGGRLINAIVEHACGIGLTQLEIFVSSNNSVAHAFYNRHGFREVGRIPNGFTYKGQSFADIIMIRHLS